MSESITLNVTPAQFLIDFPAFGLDTQKYPGQTVLMYLTLATKVLNKNRFGDYLNLASELFAAHYLTLDAADMEVAEAGGIMGQKGGQVASKSLGAGSISFDTAGSVEPGGGQWNLTTFGKRYYRLAMMAGSGAVQISGGGSPGDFPGQNIGIPRW